MVKKLFPVSYSQERMWCMDNFLQSHDIFALNIPSIIKVKGDLNFQVFKDSLKEIVMGNSSFQCLFVEKNGELYQYVSNKFSFEPMLEDVTNLNKRDKYRRIKKIVKEKIEYNFSKSENILFQNTIIKTNHNRFIVIFLFHHIISDEWSLKLFFDELSTIYEKKLNKKKVSLTLNTDYLEFCTWQKKWFQGDIFEKQLAYWHEQLQGLPKIIPFPSDKVGKNRISKSSYYHHFLSRKLCKQLKEFSHNNNVTIFCILLAAYKILLHIYSLSREIAVAIPIANRHYKKAKDTIGCYVGQVLVKNYFDETVSFVRFAKIVNKSLLEAFDNQDMPYNILMDKLDKLGGPEKYFPQFVFEYKISNHYLPRLPGLTLSEYRKTSQRSHKIHLPFKLIDLEVEYASDLFNKESMKTLMNTLVEIITQGMKSPDSPILLSQKSIKHIPKKEADKNTFIHQIVSDNKKNSKKTTNFFDDALTIEKINKCIKLSAIEVT